MKTVFEGIVNGQKFDNVEDYNKALTLAIKNGEQIQASSRTYSDGAEIDNSQSSTKSIPNFYIGMNPDNYYMNIMTGDNEQDDHALDKCCQVLEATFDEIANALEEIPNNELNEYLTNLNNIIEKLDKDHSDNENMIKKFNFHMEKLSKEMDEVNEKLNLCINCKSLNDEMTDFYKAVQREVKTELDNRLDNFQENREEKENPNTPTIGECNCSFNEIQQQQEVLLDGVRKLLNEIFNK